MHVLISNINGDPNVGLYGFATDKYALFGKINIKFVKKLEEVLKVPVLRARIYGTDLVGLFCTGNSQTLIVPSVIFEKELDKIQSEVSELKLNICLLHTSHSALGNLILMNDKKAIVSRKLPDVNVKQLGKFAKVKVLKTNLGKTSVPGSLGVVNNKGGLFSTMLSKQELEKVERFFGFEVGIGSVNMGSPFISSGLVANSYGFVIGDRSSGFEIARADESLGFLS